MDFTDKKFQAMTHILREQLEKGDRYFKFDHPITEDRILGKIKALKRNENQIDLSKTIYRIYGLLFGIISRIQCFTFQFLKKIISIFIKPGKIDKYYILKK